MKKIFLILTLLLFSCAHADIFNYPNKLEYISKQIPDLKSIKCTFREEKNLVNIEKPLVSGGDFEFIKGKGVYFHTKYPVESSVSYTASGYKRINDIINAIASKRYSKLEKEFNFYYEKNDIVWSIGLKPKKNSDAYNYINSVILYGTSYINRIIINQTNGNKTSIWFKKLN